MREVRCGRKKGKGPEKRKHTRITSAGGSKIPEGGGRSEEACKRKFERRTDEKNISR